MDKGQIQCKLMAYRNGLYQGQMRQGSRQGQGILQLDEGPILVANWKHGLPTGKAFTFLNHQEYAYLSFYQGHLEGYCYFCSQKEMLVVQFANGGPVEQQLLVNFYQNKVRIMIFRNGVYQTVQELKLEERQEEQIILRYLGITLPIPPLVDYLQAEFCSQKGILELKGLPNGQSFFRARDEGSPLSLGFVVGKKEQLVSYGHYLQGKLEGFGCKIDANAEYTGEFEAGQLHGLGQVFSNNKITFGRFEGGTLLKALVLEERSPASEQKLRELRRKGHIQSIFFENDYLPKDPIHFKGIAEIRPNSQQFSQQSSQLSYKTNQSPTRDIFDTEQTPPTSSHLKGSNVSLNQLLSSKLQVKTIPSESQSVFRNSEVASRRHERREWVQQRRSQVGRSSVKDNSFVNVSSSFVKDRSSYVNDNSFVKDNASLKGGVQWVQD